MVTGYDNSVPQFVMKTYDTLTTSPVSVATFAVPSANTTMRKECGAWSPDGTRFLSGIYDADTRVKYYDTSTWVETTGPTYLPAMTGGKGYHVKWVGNRIYMFSQNPTANASFYYITGGSNVATTWTKTFLYDVFDSDRTATMANVLLARNTSGSTYPINQYSPTEAHPVNRFSDLIGAGTSNIYDFDAAPFVVAADIETADNADIAATPSLLLYFYNAVTQASLIAALVSNATQHDLLGALSLSFVADNTLLDNNRVFVALGAELSPQLVTNPTITQLTLLLQQLTFGYSDVLSQSTTLGEATSALLTLYPELLEQVLLSPAVSSMLEASAVLAESMALASVAAYFNDTDVDQGMLLTVSLTEMQKAYLFVEQQLALLGITDLLNSVFVQVPESVQMSADLTSQASLTELLGAIFRVNTLVDIAGETYSVLAVNTRTGAVTRYSNYAYNSYVGLTKAGRLMVKVITSERGKDGAPKERWYAMKQSTLGGTSLGGRIPLGVGIKSRYWQFELANIEGDDFELDVIDLDMIRLSRRG